MEVGVKSGKVKCYQHVPKSVQTRHESKVTTSCNQQVPTLAINWTSQTAITTKSGHMYADRCCNFWGQKCDQERSREASKNIRTLQTEIQRMWNVKAKVIPVIIRDNGTIPNWFRKYLTNIPGKRGWSYRKRPHWALHTHIAESADTQSKIRHGATIQ